jgi:hypothetical protein
MSTTTSESIKVGQSIIVCSGHPEWGTWGVRENCDGYFVILGNGGSRILTKGEADKFWKVIC